MPKQKTFKGFMEDAEQGAAFSFITQTQAEREKTVIKAEGEETKSKRLNLLIKPSTHQKISKIAVMKRVSTNELINSVLEEYATNNQDKIKAYNATFGKEG